MEWPSGTIAVLLLRMVLVLIWVSLHIIRKFLVKRQRSTDSTGFSSIAHTTDEWCNDGISTNQDHSNDDSTEMINRPHIQRISSLAVLPPIILLGVGSFSLFSVMVVNKFTPLIHMLILQPVAGVLLPIVIICINHSLRVYLKRKLVYHTTNMVQHFQNIRSLFTCKRRSATVGPIP